MWIILSWWNFLKVNFMLKSAGSTRVCKQNAHQKNDMVPSSKKSFFLALSLSQSWAVALCIRRSLSRCFWSISLISSLRTEAIIVHKTHSLQSHNCININVSEKSQIDFYSSFRTGDCPLVDANIQGVTKKLQLCQYCIPETYKRPNISFCMASYSFHDYMWREQNTFFLFCFSLSLSLTHTHTLSLSHTHTQIQTHTQTHRVSTSVLTLAQGCNFYTHTQSGCSVF